MHLPKFAFVSLYMHRICTTHSPKTTLTQEKNILQPPPATLHHLIRPRLSTHLHLRTSINNHVRDTNVRINNRLEAPIRVDAIISLPRHLQALEIADRQSPRQSPNHLLGRDGLVSHSIDPVLDTSILERIARGLMLDALSHHITHFKAAFD